MFSIDRQQEIMNVIKLKRTTRVAELSKQLFISEATIRRDLEKLEKNGLIRRVYGGAILLEGLDTVASLAVREYEFEKAKGIIGKLASQLVSDNNALFLDSGSTVLRMIPHLAEKKSMTVITISPKTAMLLGETFAAKVYCTGGRLQEGTMTFVGETAKRFISEHNVDSVFLSCRGLSIENGVTEFSDDVSEIKRLMIRHSKSAYLLCDSTKFDQSYFSTVCGIESIKAVITETKPSDRWMEYFSNNNVTLLLP